MGVVLVALPACHAQVGPTLGWAIGRGLSFGAEGGGGYALVRGNAGVSVRPAASQPKAPPDSPNASSGKETAVALPQDPQDPTLKELVEGQWEPVYYAAWEPFLLSIGVAHSDQGLGVDVGAWW